MATEMDQDIFEEILRLYYEEGWSLDRIYASQDICKQTVDDWLERNEFSFRVDNLSNYTSFHVASDHLIMLFGRRDRYTMEFHY